MRETNATNAMGHPRTARSSSAICILDFCRTLEALAPASKGKEKDHEIEVLMAGCPAATCWASLFRVCPEGQAASDLVPNRDAPPFQKDQKQSGSRKGIPEPRCKARIRICRQGFVPRTHRQPFGRLARYPFLKR